MSWFAKSNKRERYPHAPPNFMTDFENILNAEIVESGRVPDARIIKRATELVEVLEDYFNTVSVLTPIVSAQEDLITFQEPTEEVGFSLFISVKRKDNSVEEELVVWNKIDNFYLTFTGTLKESDFQYAFKRE